MLPTVPKVRKPVPEKPPELPSKVFRHRTGKAPVWLDKTVETEIPNFASLGTFSNVDVDVKDRRLSRLEAVDNTEDVEERVERHRKLLEETLVISEKPQEEEPTKPSRPVIQPVIIELKEEDIESRRERAKRLALEQAEAEALARDTVEDEDKEAVEESDDEMEEEEDDEDEEEESEELGWDQIMPSSVPKIQPKFVKKDKRQTVTEKESAEAEQERLAKEAEQAAEERRQRTLHNLKENLAREKEVINPNEDVFDSDDEDDEGAQEKEFELWKLRELQRIRRDREEREKWRTEQQEVERRRQMTDDELQREKVKLKEGVKEKKTMRFLQKYYHKGAFYADELGALRTEHEWTAPTGEDKYVDKTLLPTVMQVKNFGRAGRTKYTHLKDQDTTKWDDPWMTAAGNTQVQKKMGGFHGNFERPTKRRKVDV